MIERIEVTPGAGTVIRYGGIAAWADPTASPALISFLAQSARNLGPSPRGGRQIADHIAGVLAGRDPEPHVAFVVIGPSDHGWASLLHGPVQAWDGARWLAPTPSPGWLQAIITPRPAITVGGAGAPAPPVQPDVMWDLEAGVVPGAGFVLVPGAAPGRLAVVRPASEVQSPPDPESGSATSALAVGVGVGVVEGSPLGGESQPGVEGGPQSPPSPSGVGVGPGAGVGMVLEAEPQPGVEPMAEPGPPPGVEGAAVAAGALGVAGMVGAARSVGSAEAPEAAGAPEEEVPATVALAAIPATMAIAAVAEPDRDRSDDPTQSTEAGAESTPVPIPPVTPVETAAATTPDQTAAATTPDQTAAAVTPDQTAASADEIATPTPIPESEPDLTPEPVTRRPVPPGPPGSLDLRTATATAGTALARGPGPDQRIPGAPVVAGVLCRRGHLNRPGLSACARCRTPLPPEARDQVSGTRPPLGVLITDSGAIYRLDRGYLVGSNSGRDPTVGGGLARPLVLTGSDVSGSHAEVRLTDWDVSVVDRGSAAGTCIFEPGGTEWARLRPYEPRALAPGTHVAFGQRVVTFISPWVASR